MSYLVTRVTVIAYEVARFLSTGAWIVGVTVCYSAAAFILVRAILWVGLSKARVERLAKVAGLFGVLLMCLLFSSFSYQSAVQGVVTAEASKGMLYHSGAGGPICFEGADNSSVSPCREICGQARRAVEARWKAWGWSTSPFNPLTNPAGAISAIHSGGVRAPPPLLSNLKGLECSQVLDIAVKKHAFPLDWYLELETVLVGLCFLGSVIAVTYELNYPDGGRQDVHPHSS